MNTQGSARRLLVQLTVLGLVAAGWFVTIANSAAPSYIRETSNKSGDIQISFNDNYSCLPAFSLSAPAHAVTVLDANNEVLLSATCNADGDCVEGVEFIDEFSDSPECSDPATVQAQRQGTYRDPDAGPAPEVPPSPITCEVRSFPGRGDDCDGAFHIVAETADGAKSVLNFKQTYKQSGYGCSVASGGR